MIQPSFEEFRKLSKKGNLIALRSELPSDLETPVSAFLKLAQKEPHAFLFESAEQEERIGRYSFLGFHPEKILKGKSGEKNILETVRRILGTYCLANPEGLPSFAGGFVGFLGYESVRQFEGIRLREKKGLALDDSTFFLVRDFLLFDHFQKTLSAISLAEIREGTESELRKKYREAIGRATTLVTRLKRRLRLKKERERRETHSHFKANLSQNEFEKRVRKIRDYIREGDCIQVVYSQRFNLGRVRDDFQIYRSLRSINPSPYMFYFRSGPLHLIGSSPELLVKKTDRVAEVRPIAGTRPRGKTKAEDGRFEENLTRSVKERAEHLMLVDLGRNDLGRVCEFKSIRVENFAQVERYSHVMHLVSTVTGRLKRGKDAFDLLKATFPAGTVTGAPKIRAMEIIDELEPERRGPYAGCLGYFSFNQNMDMCITIRTIVVTENQAYVQAGAGVVYDSLPRREYEETLNKAKALFQAVRGVTTKENFSCSS